MKKRYIVMLLVFMMAGCGKDSINLDDYNRVLAEAFVTRTHEYEDGYKKVNSLLLMGGKSSGVEAVLIEDFYDKNNNYIKTKLLYSELEKGDLEVWVDEPKTLYLESIGFTNTMSNKNLSDEEQKELTDYLIKIYEDHLS
ncbi:hypothetical protein ACLIA0_03990 [Bacillaceae bacterium W0354]